MLLSFGIMPKGSQTLPDGVQEPCSSWHPVGIERELGLLSESPKVPRSLWRRNLAGAGPTFDIAARLRRRLGAASAAELLLFGSLPGLTILAVVVSLAVPKILGPTLFGQYSLVEAVFRYGVAFDLGLSVLVDRRVPVLLAGAAESQLEIFASAMLWLRLYIAVAAFGVGVVLFPLLSVLGDLQFGWPLGMIALVTGLLGMLLQGPISIERARSHRRKFAVIYGGSLAVLTFGRLLGVMAGGVMGCFALMGVCYAALTLRSYQPMLRLAGRPDAVATRAFLRESAPLFVAIYSYTLLVTANRWVVSSLTDATDLGQFAFGANVTMLIIVTVGGMAQLWYPRLANRYAAGENLAVSRRITRDLAALALGLAVVSMIGVALGPWLMELVYPKFSASQAVVRVILASVPAFAVSGWLLPLALATGARPWLDGVLVHVIAILVLVATTEGGFRLDGIVGASWGMVVTMPVLVGLQLWRLHGRHVMVGRDAAALSSVVAFATVATWLFAWLT